MKRIFGQTNEGKEVYLFTLKNNSGMTAAITNYGGIVVSLMVPDKNGQVEDVVLGFDYLEDYLEKNPFFGAIIGRHANRIEKGIFELNGKVYHLYRNNGNNHLHGGLKGFDKVVWEVKAHNPRQLKLFYRSVDGEEGYPGNLDVTVTYTLTDTNEFMIEYEAVSDADTVVNLTNHSYFNLSGHGSGDILNHRVKINADRFTVNNEECLPVGEIQDVSGTPMDLREPKSVEEGLKSGSEHILCAGGYDHNFVLNVSGKKPEYCAEVYDPVSGRKMEVYTTKPGIQFYSGNNLKDGLIGKQSVEYKKRSGLCLETQYFPNAMKHKHFPSPVLKAGELYRHTTLYKFV